MLALETPSVDKGETPPDFALKGVDGKTWTLADVAGPRGLVVMFICNHCPYVKAVIDRIVADMAELKKIGVGAVAIMSNDTVNYPDDSYENMKLFAQAHRFGFPYLLDETQDVARAYGAVCTPDFFGYNNMLELQYRGRLDESRKDAAPNAKRELLLAMKEVAEKDHASQPQFPSIGCSIKWR